MRRISNARRTLYTLPLLASLRRMSETHAFIPMHAFDFSRMYQRSYYRLFSENAVPEAVSLESDSSIKSSDIQNDLFYTKIQELKDDSPFIQVRNDPLHHSYEINSEFPSTMSIHNLLVSKLQ